MQLLRPLRARRTAVLLTVILGISAAGLAGDADLRVRRAADAERAPLPPPDMDPFLGVVLDEHSGFAAVARVVAGSAAESAGVVAGDVLASVDSSPVSAALDLERTLHDRGVGAKVRLGIVRSGRAIELPATIGLRRRPDECFRGSHFDLAVVPLAFADDTAPVADPARLTRLLFTKTGATGAGASLADYYRVQSYGRLDVGGRVLSPVTLPRPRSTYAAQPMGGSPGSAFDAAAAMLVAREGAAAMAAFDGLAFLYGGEVESRPGFALWPHRSVVAVAGRRLPYYVHAAGEAEAMAIGVHCHEFGHLLGLPDTYGTGHVTGCGDFCLMAIGHRGGAKDGARAPFSLCAWCRMRLAWLDPVVVDPRTPQRIRLASVARGPGEALLVPLDPRTDEYLLLEVRRREQFDAELPSAGLLVWHVGGAATPGQGRYGSYVDLVEAHGVDAVDASLVRTDEIAFPTPRAHDLTPDTTPAIASSGSDGFRAYLTGIESRPDGSVDLTLGVPRRVTQTAPEPVPGPRAGEDGSVVRTDPITGCEIRLYVGPGDAAAPAPSGGAERR
jgi:M6 family metalloprotease-like protein